MTAIRSTKPGPPRLPARSCGRSRGREATSRAIGSVLIADPAVPPRPGDRVVRRRSDGGYDIGVLREVTSKGYRVDALGSGKPGKIEGVDLRDLAKLSAILFP